MSKGWHRESRRHSLASRGIKTTDNIKTPIQTYSVQHTNIKTLNNCNYYHQTSVEAAQSIIENGFYVEEGGNQRFTEGVYLLNHPGGDYGDTTLNVCVSGNFLDFSDDQYGDKWLEFKHKYWRGNYTKLTQDIRNDYPQIDGIMFENMLVVWKPEKLSIIGVE